MNTNHFYLNPKYKQWRSKCLFRDKWRCRICGSRKKISVHHLEKLESIVKFKQFHLLWDIGNGITLCQSCHNDIHAVEELAKGNLRESERLFQKEKFINQQCVGNYYDENEGGNVWVEV